ncbi:MAG: hypothetical protein AVO39_07905 [delta proteobacterium MLS_D]|jgi:hypothetical protein|nr:MAG: hypothetical protein AVO39_07905 [delta proteobacterium MLS_D]
MAGQIYDIIRSMLFDSAGLVKAGATDTRGLFEADFGESLREAAQKILKEDSGWIVKKHGPDGVAIMPRADTAGNRGEVVASESIVTAAVDESDGCGVAAPAVTAVFDEGDGPIRALVKNGAFLRVTDGIVKLYLPGRDGELTVASSDGKQLHLLREKTMQAGRAFLFEKAPGGGDGRGSTVQAPSFSAGGDNKPENDVSAKQGARIPYNQAKPADFSAVSKLFFHGQGSSSKTLVMPGSEAASVDLVPQETTATVTGGKIPGGRGADSAVKAAAVMPGSAGDVNSVRKVVSAKSDATASRGRLDASFPAVSKPSFHGQASPSKTPVVPGSGAVPRDVVPQETTAAVTGGRIPGGRGVASAVTDAPVSNGSPGDVEHAPKGGASMGEAVERLNGAAVHRHLSRPATMSVSRDAQPAVTVDGSGIRPEGREHHFQRQANGNHQGDGKTFTGVRDEQSFVQRARVDTGGERLSPAAQAQVSPAEGRTVERPGETVSSAVRATTAGFSGGEDGAVENKHVRLVGETAGSRELLAGGVSRPVVSEERRLFRGGNDGKIFTAGVDGPGGAGENHRGSAAARTSPDMKIISTHLSSMAASQGKDGSQRMRIQLQPPHLGSLDMEVIMHDKTVRVLLRVDSGEAGRFLQAGTEQLKGALQEQGFTVESFSVAQRDQEAGFSRYDGRGGAPFEGENGEENGRNGERSLPDPGQDDHIGRSREDGQRTGRLSFFV